jgi:hypothetical protein
MDVKEIDAAGWASALPAFECLLRPSVADAPAKAVADGTAEALDKPRQAMPRFGELGDVLVDLVFDGYQDWYQYEDAWVLNNVALGDDAEVTGQYLSHARRGRGQPPGRPTRPSLATSAMVPRVTDEESEEADGQPTAEVTNVPNPARDEKRKRPDASDNREGDQTRKPDSSPATGKDESGPRRSSRLKKQKSEQAFGDLDIIAGPKCEAWRDQKRGCQRARVILGPQAGVEWVMDSDAVSTLPPAISDVRRRYPEYGWKAGHVINANFGGDGSDFKNMTCLTASANGQQNGFDGPVARARTALHKAYSIMRECGADHTFFSEQKFGIMVTGEPSDDTWDADYPGNCISNTLNLRAEVVNPPSRADLRRVMGASRSNNLENDIAAVLEAIETVHEEVREANASEAVTNKK